MNLKMIDYDKSESWTVYGSSVASAKSSAAIHQKLLLQMKLWERGCGEHKVK